jgi:hypothetical protein
LLFTIFRVLPYPAYPFIKCILMRTIGIFGCSG